MFKTAYKAKQQEETKEKTEAPCKKKEKQESLQEFTDKRSAMRRGEKGNSQSLPTFGEKNQAKRQKVLLLMVIVLAQHE